MALAEDEILCLPDESDWNDLATVTGIEVNKLRNDYLVGVERYIEKPRRITVDEAPSDNREQESGFEFGGSVDITVIPGVLAIHVEYDLKAGEDWEVAVFLTARVFGKDVGNAQFKLSRTQSFIEIHPSALLVKADLKIGVYGQRLCLGIEGQACYWAFGWKCQPINKQEVFCFLK